MKKYYDVDFEKQRELLLKSEKAKPIIEIILKNADEAILKTYEALKFSEYMLFVETGNRTIFEKNYFERRNDCSYISIAYWLTNDEKYKKPLIDGIFRICDEFTWCLPAHAGLEGNPFPSTECIQTQIDLFQAETGRLLTDIDAIVGEKLPCYVTDRINAEIRKRIIEPMKIREFWWFIDCKNNWAAVCAGGVGVALLHYGTDAEIKHILPKLYNAMENFLAGYNDDGCCTEGYAYWGYGFGYFVIFARMILDYTQGKINYFGREKVKKIAQYLQKVRLGKTKTVSFSDGGSTFTFSPGLMSYLKSLYPDEVSLPDLKLGIAIGNVYSVKELLWFDTDYKEDDYKEETNYFDGAEWFIKRGKNFSFAAKAGHNDEPHNHNDIGSFMIVTKDDIIPLADLGCGVYNSQTFNPEYRYKMIQNSSAGHSVPIVNGEFQKEGRRYSASNISYSDDKFEFDMENAYEDSLVKKLHRSFDIKDDYVILCDTIEYSKTTKEIIERMISYEEPKISDGYVDLKNAGIFFDNNKYSVNFSKDSFRNHSDTADTIVYLIDFKAKAEKETKFEFKISIK